LIGQEKYDEYWNTINQKIDLISKNSSAETVDDGNTGGSASSFNGPYTIALDSFGSIYDASTLPFQLNNGKATYNGAPISLMCIQCFQDCASCAEDSFLVLDSGYCNYGSCPWGYIKEENKNTCVRST